MVQNNKFQGTQALHKLFHYTDRTEKYVRTKQTLHSY